MIDAEVIIVGGGPAASTCAWKLREAGIETDIQSPILLPDYTRHGR